jgi:hypothetical protein
MTDADRVAALLFLMKQQRTQAFERLIEFQP